MSLSSLQERHDSILRELQEERAAALVRIARTLEAAIEGLRAAGIRFASAEGVERDRERTAYRELRETALRYRWYLEVQREALGLRQHDRLDEFYAIPPSLDDDPDGPPA